MNIEVNMSNDIIRAKNYYQKYLQEIFKNNIYSY